jgi:hypothetical protein
MSAGQIGTFQGIPFYADEAYPGNLVFVVPVGSEDQLDLIEVLLGERYLGIMVLSDLERHDAD